jgi:hypothetical protein
MLAFPGLLLFAFFQAASPAAVSLGVPQAAAAAPRLGSPHFRSEAMHLAFDVPEGVEVRPDAADKANEVLKEKSKSPAGEPCTTIPLLAFNPKVIQRIYLYQTDATCFAGGLTQERLRTSAASILTAMLHTMGTPSVASAIDYSLGGKPAVVTTGNVFSEQNHGIVFGEVGCVLLDSYSACWVFMAGSADKVARLAALPVRFDGQEPAPIVPDDVSRLSVPSTITYHDDARHFEFTYPGTFADAHQLTADVLAKKADEAKGKEKTAISCIKTSLTGSEITDTSHSSMLIFNVNAECQKLKVSLPVLKDFAKGIVIGVGKTAAKSEAQAPVTYSLAGHDAALVQAKLTKATGSVVFITEACAIVSNDFLCWQFYSDSLERLNQVAGSRVAFAGQLPVAVVPPELLKKQ